MNAPVRQELQNLGEGKRFTFEATFKRLGVDRRFPHLGKILLTSILLVETINGSVVKREVTDHVWVPKSKRWGQVLKASISQNDSISFTAEVKEYIKEGDTEFFTDFGLSSLRSVNIL